MTKDESSCPIPAKKAKNDETDDRIEDEQSKLDEELLSAAKECFILDIKCSIWSGFERRL